MAQGSISQAQSNKSLLSLLGLINLTSVDKLVEKYGNAASDNYIVLSEAMGGLSKCDHDEFYHYEKTGRVLPKIVVNATVVAPGAGVAGTITLKSTVSYPTGITSKSPVATGQHWRNLTNGFVYEVGTVVKTSNGAHTAVMTPIVSTVNAAFTANDEFLYLGHPKSGEAATAKEGLYPVYDKITNYITTINYGVNFTDKQLQEKIDIADSPYFQMGVMKDAEEIMLRTQELELMFGVASDNGSVINSHTGLLSRIASSSTTITNSGAVDLTLFKQIKRQKEAEGFSNEYDLLCDMELRMKIEDFIQTNTASGGIVYGDFKGSKSIDINRNFKRLSYYGIDLNLMDYAYFNPSKVWGATVSTGIYQNYGAMIPKGFGSDAKTGTKVPRFGVKYQPIVGENPEGGDIVHVKRTGGLAATPTSQSNTLDVSWTTMKGLQTFGITAYNIIDL